MQVLIHSAAFALTFFIGFCQIVLQEFPLLHDYPEWMFQGWIFQQLLSGTNAAVIEQYSIVQYPVPNSLSQFVIAVLNFFTTPLVAGRLWLGLYLLLSSVLWFCVARRNADALQHLLLTVLITLGPGFWNGYINFQFALLWFAIYLYLDLYRHQHGPWLTGVFSLLIFFSHAVVFAVFVAFCLSRAVVRGRVQNSLSATVAALTPSLVLLCWYVMNRLATLASPAETGMALAEWLQYKAYTVAKQGPFHNFVLHNGESYLHNADWLYQAGFVANFLVAGLLIGWCGFLLWRYAQHGAGAILRIRSSSLLPVMICLLLCATTFLASGTNSFGVVNLGERFLIVMLLLFLMLFSCPLPVKYALATFCVVFTLLTCVATAQLSTTGTNSYSVARSSSEQAIEQYVDDIYANSRHKYFNHRLFIYADRGQQLVRKADTEIDLNELVIDLDTSIIALKK